jgi:shikimate dehydrogenase
MIKLGLIGYPVSHSLSPKIQNAALIACGLEGDYSLFPIAPDDMPALKDLLDRVRSGEITGLNVTIPHKQNVIRFMDDLTPTAKSIGAVSVIYLREKKLIGDNADAPGFLSDLKRFLTTETHSHNDANALVLGAGGSARAVVYALINDGWNVTIASRRIGQSQELAAQFKTANAIDFNFQIFKLSGMQLIVNTTPLGMTPNINTSPLPEDILLPSHAVIYDLVYNPRETKLVREARSQGLRATTGLGMLVEQAALGFELWTGNKLPSEIFRNAVE